MVQGPSPTEKMIRCVFSTFVKSEVFTAFKEPRKAYWEMMAMLDLVLYERSQDWFLGRSSSYPL